jgi:hypothetical protein
MTHRTTTSTRRAAVPVLLALTLVGTTAAASPASAAPARTVATATSSASAGQTTDLGFLTRITRTTRGTTLTFDRAILLTGAAAKAEQRRRGLDTTSDVFVQNDNRLLRTRTVAPGVAVVGSQALTGSPTATPVTLDRLRSHLAARPAGRSGPLFRLTLDRRNHVVRIAEVYLP